MSIDTIELDMVFAAIIVAIDLKKKTFREIRESFSQAPALQKETRQFLLLLSSENQAVDHTSMSPTELVTFLQDKLA
jgi:hypothetical protein